MTTESPDDLVLFPDVRVIRSTSPALLCSIAGKSVWLPRGHVSGKLWCAGDRGKLYVRRWVARDRRLIGDPPGATPSTSPTRLPVPIRLVAKDRVPHEAE
jgi:hypothetical protein